MRKLMGTGLLAIGLALWASTGPAAACGPSQPLTSADLLQFQIGLIERGLTRESLTQAQKSDIAALRTQVEAAHAAERREDARAAMLKIVAMFKHKEMFGSVEPVVPGCAPTRVRAPLVTGVLVDLAIEPNHPGTRCGNHYVLTVKEDGAAGAARKLTVFDLEKAPYESLQAMLNKRVEVETIEANVASIRLAEVDRVAGLAGLSTVRPC